MGFTSCSDLRTYICMKTTMEISDALILRAKAFARREHTTLRALTEEGLAKVLDEKSSAPAVQVKPVTFKGKGLSESFQGAEWAVIRDAAYASDA